MISVKNVLIKLKLLRMCFLKREYEQNVQEWSRSWALDALLVPEGFWGRGHWDHLGGSGTQRLKAKTVTAATEGNLKVEMLRCGSWKQTFLDSYTRGLLRLCVNQGRTMEEARQSCSPHRGLASANSHRELWIQSGITELSCFQARGLAFVTLHHWSLDRDPLLGKCTAFHGFSRKWERIRRKHM